MCMFLHNLRYLIVIIALPINIGIGTYFAYVFYSRWYLKKILLVLSLTHVLNEISIKQQFNECNSTEFINRKSQINEDEKWNLLFLHRYN